MRAYAISCGLLLAISATTLAYTSDDKYVEVHDMDHNELPPVDPPAPMDPAVHDFPMVPSAPVLPTCMERGYFRDPFNCAKFYHCEYDGAVPVAFYCQTGLIFDTITDSCDDPRYVQC